MTQDPHLFRYLEAYAKLKMHLVPVAGHDWQGDWDLGKQPLISIYEASCDLAVLEAWAKKWPGCNWGWVPQQGRANLDVDPRHGGDAALARLEARFDPLPIVPRVRTGSGGWHDTFAVPAEMAFDVDIEGNEGLTFSSGKRQFILPPSIHRNGTPYVCERKFSTTPVLPAPEWLLAFATAKAKARHDTTRPATAPMPTRPTRFKAAAASLSEDPGAEDGSRGKTLARLLGIELAKGRSPEEIEPEALAWAERCVPPLPQDRVLRCLDSLTKRHERRSESAISGTTHTTTQDMEGLLLEPGKEGTISAEAQAPGEQAHRPDFIPSFQASAEAGADADVGDFVPSFQPEAEDQSLLPNMPSKEAMLQAQAPTVAWAREFIPSFRLPDANAFTLTQEARIGFVKQFADAIEPQVEGDIGPVALCLLTAFGSAIGHGPFVAVGAGRHHANLYACTVALSGIGKSEPWDVVYRLMEKADPQWNSQCVCNGLGSGEGLVERLCDGWTEAKADKKGQMQFVQHPGAANKNLFVFEAELSKVINLGRREGATLSQNLCCGWDGKPMEVANRGQNKLKASDHHLSIWGNVTLAYIRQKIRNSLEEENGFVNRFLWPWQSLRRSLPFGGDMVCLDALAPVLAQAITRAKAIGQVRWAACGARTWEEAYPRLKAAQTHLAALGRARGQALRLALLYALLDGADEIREAHVVAGLGVWAYAEASARLIFGDESAGPSVREGVAPAKAGAVLQAISQRPGISRKGLYDVLGHGIKAEALSDALLWLEGQGHVFRRTVKTGTGRPAECWWPAQGPAPGTGPQQHSPNRGTTEAGAGTLAIQADAVAHAQERRKEGIMSLPVASGQAAADAGKEGIISQARLKPLAKAEDSSFLPTPPAPALHSGGVGCAVQQEAHAIPDCISFGAATPVPEGWLDGRADAALIERIWPVPKGWHRQAHGIGWLHEVDERGVSGRNVFNPAWPVAAWAWGEGVEYWEKLVDEDPEVYRVIQPQPLSP